MAMYPDSHRDALSSIMESCAASRTYSRRIQFIHETAMRALGLTASQRNRRHLEIIDRVGPNPGKDAYVLRDRRRAEQAARYQRQLAGEAAAEGLPRAPRPFIEQPEKETA